MHKRETVQKCSISVDMTLTLENFLPTPVARDGRNTDLSIVHMEAARVRRLLGVVNAHAPAGQADGRVYGHLSNVPKIQLKILL